MTPLSFDEALAMVKLVDDWGPIIEMMPTKQRNYMKKGMAGRLPSVNWRVRNEEIDEVYTQLLNEEIDEVYAQLLHEASQL